MITCVLQLAGLSVAVVERGPLRGRAQVYFLKSIYSGLCGAFVPMKPRLVAGAQPLVMLRYVTADNKIRSGHAMQEWNISRKEIAELVRDAMNAPSMSSVGVHPTAADVEQGRR